MLQKSIASLAVVLGLAAVTHAAPIFYLSTAADAASAPNSGLLELLPGSTGTFGIFANSDIQLAGVSLDLVVTGPVIKLTGLDVKNPHAGSPDAARWFALDGPQVVTDKKISSIGGAAIPGLSGNGIGTGSAEGAKVLLATVSYQVVAQGTSILQLQIGTNTVAAWDGTFPTVFFGTQSGTGVDGGIPGGAGVVGSITIIMPEHATISMVGLTMVCGLGFIRRR